MSYAECNFSSAGDAAVSISTSEDEATNPAQRASVFNLFKHYPCEKASEVCDTSTEFFHFLELSDSRGLTNNA